MTIFNLNGNQGHRTFRRYPKTLHRVLTIDLDSIGQGRGINLNILIHRKRAFSLAQVDVESGESWIKNNPPTVTDHRQSLTKRRLAIVGRLIQFGCHNRGTPSFKGTNINTGNAISIAILNAGISALINGWRIEDLNASGIDGRTNLHQGMLQNIPSIVGQRRQMSGLVDNISLEEPRLERAVIIAKVIAIRRHLLQQLGIPQTTRISVRRQDRMGNTDIRVRSLINATGARFTDIIRNGGKSDRTGGKPACKDPTTTAIRTDISRDRRIRQHEGRHIIQMQTRSIQPAGVSHNRTTLDVQRTWITTFNGNPATTAQRQRAVPAHLTTHQLNLTSIRSKNPAPFSRSGGRDFIS